jgi:hypothetical protein
MRILRAMQAAHVGAEMTPRLEAGKASHTRRKSYAQQELRGHD